jgi:hypothetical protein
MHLRTYNVAVPLFIIFFISPFFFMPEFSFANSTDWSYGGIFKRYEFCRREEPRPIQLAEAGMSVGMTKLEVYEIKGTPYKIKRPSGEENREAWVYRCMNSDGFQEDCLYLFFEDDRLVKIDDL